jgi:hypothetical protein
MIASDVAPWKFPVNPYGEASWWEFWHCSVSKVVNTFIQNRGFVRLDAAVYFKHSHIQ